MALDLTFGNDSTDARALEVRQHLYKAGQEGISDRFNRLDRRHAFYRCTEYEHLKFDWSGRPADQVEVISPRRAVPEGFTTMSVEQPVHMRRPRTPWRITPLIVDGFSDLLFSEDRVPVVTVEGDDDADDWLREMWKQAGLFSKMYLARSHGGAMGSALVTFKIVDGMFYYKVFDPRFVADIVWDDRDELQPAGVLIQYLTTRSFEEMDKHGQATGKLKQKAFVYRRIIDAEWDIVFREAAFEDGEMPEDMVVDLKQSRRHAVGAFPGVWIQNLPSDDDIDGIPDCDGAWQMMEALDRMNSQIDMSLLANLDPTLVIARDLKVKALAGEIKKGSNNALDVGPSGSAHYLEMAAGGVSEAREWCKDQKGAIQDKTGFMFPDPEKQSGAAQSAHAIELIREPTIAKASRLREQYGAKIRKLAELTLQAARLWSDKLQYDGRARPEWTLPNRVKEVDADPTNPNAPPVFIETPRNPGTRGIVTLRWGAYYSPTTQDMQAVTSAIASLCMASLMDVETAVRLYAPMFRIQDVEGLIRKVREEKDAKAQMEFDAYAGTGMFGAPPPPLAPEEEGMVSPQGVVDDPLSSEGQDANVPQEMANGAQVTAAKDIIISAANREIPKSSAIQMFVSFFRLTELEATSMLRDIPDAPILPPAPPQPFGGGGFGGPPEALEGPPQEPQEPPSFPPR